jgi:histidine triad (HIT) family protein
VSDCFYCNKVLTENSNVDLLFENDSAVAFHHTQPYFEHHIVVVPKNHIEDLNHLDDFSEIWSDLGKLLQKSTQLLGETLPGCRVSTNVGNYQSTRHLHFYVHAGKRLRNEDGSETVWTPPQQIRPIVIGVIKNADNQYLFMECQDHSTGKIFYRPVGGGIEFRETAEAALAREFQEELGKKIKIDDRIFVQENLFELEGLPGHEIAFAFKCEFVQPSDYEFDSIEINEPNGVKNRAVWKSIEEAKSESRPIYPKNLLQYLC